MKTTKHQNILKITYPPSPRYENFHMFGVFFEVFLTKYVQYGSNIIKQKIFLNSSYKAASYYYQNRYADDVDCTHTCKSMEVFTTMKYRKQRDSKSLAKIKLYFPKQIKVTREIEMESFASLGNTLIEPFRSNKQIKNLQKLMIANYIFFISSCRTWRLSWNDSWNQFVGY